MARTFVPSEQLNFRSAATGTHLLDTYLEACEKGGVTLPVLMENLYSSDGGLNPSALQFRVSTSSGVPVFQARFGHFTDADAGWFDTNQSFFNWRGDHAAGIAYKRLDMVRLISTQSTYICTVPHTSTSLDTTKFQEFFDGSNITSVVGSLTNINTVAGSIAGVNALAPVSAEIANLSTTEAIADMSTLGATGVVANIAAVAGVASTMSAAAANAEAAALSAAAAATALDTFDDRYLGSKSSEPSVDNDLEALVSGALFFDSSVGSMKVYDGANWIQASSAAPTSLIDYEYTATAGQTSFSGLDNNAATLSYFGGNIIVSLNGSVLDNGSDYTANGGSHIVLATAAAAGDHLAVVAFKSFLVADTVSATSGGTFAAAVTIAGGVNVSGSSSFEEIREKVSVDSTTTGTITHALATGPAIVLYNVDQTANRTINLTGANNFLDVGQSTTVVFMFKQGSTAYYPPFIQLDGIGSNTPKWQGGSAPTSGNASGIDSYSITIIKTVSASLASQACTVLASQTQFA
tara:strand:- start:335 stop:1897 length:1563 start_codon:yes stop_codon:yes gene_type:complete